MLVIRYLNLISVQSWTFLRSIGQNVSVQLKVVCAQIPLVLSSFAYVDLANLKLSSDQILVFAIKCIYVDMEDLFVDRQI